MSAKRQKMSGKKQEEFLALFSSLMKWVEEIESQTTEAQVLELDLEAVEDLMNKIDKEVR